MPGNHDNVDLSPSKETYQAVKSDVNPRSALKELVDNAIDNWTRVEPTLSALKVEIEHRPSKEGKNSGEELIIRDNSGGLEEEHLSLFFALGESAKERIEGSIGAYGIGAKKAVAYLGDTAQFRTQHVDSDRGYGFTVDEEWLNSDTWSVEKQYFDNISSGHTEIRIQDLNFSWEDVEESLRTDLSETYEILLADGVGKNGQDFELIVDGELISPPETPDWSYCPLDGYFPRRFEGFQLNPDEVDTENSPPIIMNVTVGLLREASQIESGTDIYCQQRKVLVRNTGEEGGFGSGKHKLGSFGTGQKRLRISVELETDGDAERLPWDAQKSHLNQFDPVAQEMYKYLNRVAKRYFSATYSKIPQSILRPYDETHRYAANEGEIKVHDYEGRVRVTDGPNEDANTIKQVRRIAEAHAQLGIRYEEDRLEPEAYPAYHSLLEEIFEREVSDELSQLVDIEESVTGVNYEYIERQIEKIEQHAVDNASKGIRVVNVPAWARPRYLMELEKLTDPDSLEPVERELDLSVSQNKLESSGTGSSIADNFGTSSRTVKSENTLQFEFNNSDVQREILDLLDLSPDATPREAANKLLEELRKEN